jgi:hypothetical protein
VRGLLEVQVKDLALFILSLLVHPFRLECGLDRQWFCRAQQFTRNSRVNPWAAEGHAAGQAHHQVGLVAAMDGATLRFSSIGDTQPAARTVYTS